MKSKDPSIRDNVLVFAPEVKDITGCSVICDRDEECAGFNFSGEKKKETCSYVVGRAPIKGDGQVPYSRYNHCHIKVHENGLEDFIEFTEDSEMKHVYTTGPQLFGGKDQLNLQIQANPELHVIRGNNIT